MGSTEEAFKKAKDASRKAGKRMEPKDEVKELWAKKDSTGKKIDRSNMVKKQAKAQKTIDDVNKSKKAGKKDEEILKEAFEGLRGGGKDKDSTESKGATKEFDAMDKKEKRGLFKMT